MKTQKLAQNRFIQRRQSLLRQLAHIGPFVEGSLVGVKHPRCRHIAWRLTSKVKAKTKTVYVPVDMVQEVKQWTGQYRQLKKLIRRVTSNSLALIHGHVSGQRVAQRLQLRSTKVSAGNYKRLLATASRS